VKPQLGIRWTIGDVAPRGFVALRLSLWGAYRLYGAGARYAVVVNTLSPGEAARRASPVPPGVSFEPARDLPPFLRRALDAGMAQGVAWKFAPLRLFADLHELALDNDCILWDEPDAIRRWRMDPGSAVIAEDVRPAFGRFGATLGESPRNTGIRGLPPGFDLGAALEQTLAEAPGPLRSELDEQGLQVAAVARALPLRVVPLADVSICSPFPPHLPEPGGSGVHFVGLNAHTLGWCLNGRPAEELTHEHFDRLRPVVEMKIERGGAFLRARTSL
jgi:hypothetical protein